MKIHYPLLFLFTLSSSIFFLSHSLDTISRTQNLKDGKTIVSSDNSFEFGFFTLNGSTDRYLGIWYKQISTFTPVWVANRDSPLTDSSNTLQLNARGILQLQNRTNHTVWSTNTTRTGVRNPVLQLLKSGNLVVRESNDAKPENYLWQSFDYPGDTHLPGMKLGKNLVTGKEWHISSWKSTTNPGLGTYSYWLDVRGFPQIFMSNGKIDLYRSGPWNGIRFSGTPSLSANSIYSFEMNILKDEIFYTYHLLNTSVVTRFLMNSNGNAQRLNWVDRTKEWIIYRNVPTDSCDAYKLCGAYGNCLVDQTPICSCLDKFVPKNPNDWRSTDWSGGCVRATTLECGKGEGFLKYTDIKLPDTRNSWYDTRMNLKECEQVCLKNCSCTAYTTLDIRNGGSGCLLWFDDLVDMKQFGPGTGQEIYIRMASSDLEAQPGSSSSNKKRTTVIVITTVVGGMFLLCLCLMLVLRRRKKKSQQIIAKDIRQNSKNTYADRSSSKDDLELPLLDYDMIASSTNYFSPKNKLGEGGFGPVYKGKLEGGQEIAVKRLSGTSKQGLEEFKNEVITIAKLQHRNLVKLLGCCIEERLLVYEYMVNGSLNSYIFDESRRKLLDWPRRYNIINGIARGLLYLHQDSRLRIIHRDLKASNILLDSDLNPKISDFGMARSFGGNETEGNTSTVVGTYGYMSPEYAVDGLFSVKSDVFSFGVLVMEIISGKRNRAFSHPDHDLNLLGHAWTLYKEDRQMELMDEHTKGSCVKSEVLRSIHIALLCVQQNPEDRPSMASVVLTMGSEGVLPEPKKPGFFLERNMDKNDTSTTQSIPGSVDEFTITMMEPR